MVILIICLSGILEGAMFTRLQRDLIVLNESDVT